MVLNKSKQGTAPQADSPSLGRIKLILAQKQSYILQHKPSTGKWPLVLSCTWPGHQSLMTKLFDFASTNATSKADLVKKRNAQKGAATKACSKKAAAPETESDQDIDQKELQAMAAQVLSEPIEDEADTESEEEDEDMPEWWA